MNTWLVAEDDKDSRDIVSMMITVWGYTPIAFRDGAQAIDWLDELDAGASPETLPQLALLDIRMPGYNGIGQPGGSALARAAVHVESNPVPLGIVGDGGV